MTEKNIDSFDIVAKTFKEFGWTILDRPEDSDNNPDMIVVSNRRCLKIEIKTVREKKSNGFEAYPISENQKSCDVVALVFPNGYVFIEKMSEYLCHISNTGYRYFTYLKP